MKKYNKGKQVIFCNHTRVWQLFSLKMCRNYVNLRLQLLLQKKSSKQIKLFKVWKISCSKKNRRVFFQHQPSSYYFFFGNFHITECEYWIRWHLLCVAISIFFCCLRNCKTFFILFLHKKSKTYLLMMSKNFLRF